MDVNISDILRIGLADGLIWFPFVLGVGLLYSYFKEIDISVDGIAVLSGIGCAFVWRYYDSYTLSILAGIIIGIFGSTIICILQITFKISGLMSGIVFSLAAHSLSVLMIGESLVLPRTNLIAGFGIVQWWQIPLALILIIFTFVFYNTRFGIAARKLGSGCAVNTVYSVGFLKWSGYALSGFLYGLGGAIYAHSQGMAKSGGSFEFLLVALAAYLCTVRTGEISAWLLRLVVGQLHAKKIQFNTYAQIFYQAFSSPAAKALVGAILFETLVFFTIATSPNPMLWKLIFAILLLLSLAKPGLIPSWGLTHFVGTNKLTELSIEGLWVTYVIGSERREVFNAASANFSPGINLIRGPNGTGKSTLLKSIAGIVKPIEGQIHYNGNNLLSVPQHTRPTFLLQQNPMDTLASDLTVAENLFVALEKAAPLDLGFNKNRVLSELMSQLHDLGVSPIKTETDSFWNKQVMTLSGGEAHCVAFYCALLTRAPVLLADEPTTGLDDGNFQRLTTIMRALAKDRVILLTSHDTRVDVLANREFLVGEGKIKSQPTV
ncbi:MAG: ATP-binding cassette domain-containing protein [Desulfobulbaceae bacterium]|nr:ATP-binding cassette domain-containing protein [Desulfobulbaceae bacterium]